MARKQIKSEKEEKLGHDTKKKKKKHSHNFFLRDFIFKKTLFEKLQY